MLLLLLLMLRSTYMGRVVPCALVIWMALYGAFVITFAEFPAWPIYHESLQLHSEL